MRVSSKYRSQTRCPLCRVDVQRWEAHTCLECHALLHDSCVRELGPCHQTTRPPVAEHALLGSEAKPSLAPWLAHRFRTSSAWPEACQWLSLLTVLAFLAGMLRLGTAAQTPTAWTVCGRFVLPLVVGYAGQWLALEGLLTGITGYHGARVSWHARPLEFSVRVGAFLIVGAASTAMACSTCT